MLGSGIRRFDGEALGGRRLARTPPSRLRKNSRIQQRLPSHRRPWMPGTRPGMTSSCEFNSLRHGRACPGYPRADWNSPVCSAQRFFPQPASLIASVVRNSRRLADRCIATRASREGSGECDDKPSAHRRDRVGNVPFGADRRRLWVGNPREWQIARAARRRLVLRGEGRRVRRSESRRRQYRVWRGGENRASRALHNHPSRVPA
jgi:hypothetical protein